MREAAVVREIVNRAFESPEDIEVRGLSSERHGRGSESCLAIEPSSSQNGAGKKMCDGFQTDFVPQKKPVVARC
jgi:hypothetical protein